MEYVLSLYLGVVVAICLIILLESRHKSSVWYIFFLVNVGLAISLFQSLGIYKTLMYALGLVITLIIMALFKATK